MVRKNVKLFTYMHLHNMYVVQDASETYYKAAKMWRTNSTSYLIILGDLHLKQPLSLVVECGLLLALLQLLRDSTHFISCLCSLADVSSPRESSHNQLQSIEPVFQLLLVVRQLLLELLVVLLHLYVRRLDLIRDLPRPAQCVPSVRTDT